MVGYHQSPPDHRTPSDTSSAHEPTQPTAVDAHDSTLNQEGVTGKRSFSSMIEEQQVRPFANEARSVAIDLGMLSLNSDSRQTHYLGASSGRLFTSLIGLPENPSESSTSVSSTSATTDSTKARTFALSKQLKDRCRDVYALLQMVCEQSDEEILSDTFRISPVRRMQVYYWTFTFETFMLITHSCTHNRWSMPLPPCTNVQPRSRRHRLVSMDGRRLWNPFPTMGSSRCPGEPTQPRYPSLQQPSMCSWSCRSLPPSRYRTCENTTLRRANFTVLHCPLLANAFRVHRLRHFRPLCFLQFIHW